MTQAECRERVRVLEMLEELRKLQDLREKREARARQRETVAVCQPGGSVLKRSWLGVDEVLIGEYDGRV